MSRIGQGLTESTTVSPAAELGQDGSGETVVVAVPVGEGGSVDPHWGRAQRVAVATVRQGRLSSWDEEEVGWGALREEGSGRAHHARIARFVKQHGVQVVVAHHMGGDMLAMLERMGVRVEMPGSADAHEAVLAAVGPNQGREVMGTKRPP
jgi:predicted Fe-Mo cluster-binding NifX family protein